MIEFFQHYSGNLPQLVSDYAHLGPLFVMLLLMLPLGEELILIPAGVLIGQGTFPFVTTWLLAYTGVVFSDTFWFLVARHYGTPLLHKRWFKRFAHPRRLLQAKHQLEARGAWVILTARFIPGSRTAAIVMAGMLHMPFWKFFLTDASMALGTVAFQLGLGVLVQKGFGSEDTAGRITAIVAAVVLVIVGGAVGRWIMLHRRTGGPPPRARADWLRRFRKPRPPRSARGAAGGAVTPPSSS
ncbi:MAG TPA: DedA family protein [Phycisphaerales bacterium]|nr:DedA family protein [Phycisphaerales bacterium]HMP36249.1 DedA family protein [Phycisphaerales bacterium]